MLLNPKANTLIARQKAEYNQNKIMQIIENQSIGLTIIKFIKIYRIQKQLPRRSYSRIESLTMDMKC